QHLPHPRPAPRPLVSDHDGVARLNLAGIDGRERVLLAVENARRAAVRRRRVLRDLGHRALRREVALQDDQAALGAKGSRQRDDHLLPRGLAHGLALLAERPAGYGHGIAVDVAALDEALREERYAAGPVQLHRRAAAARPQVA